MKTTIKFALIAMIATLGFYNLKISKTTDSNSNLTFVENSASADSESDGGKYKTRTESSGHKSFTLTKPDGTTCTTSYDFVSIECSGSGSFSCTPSTTKSNEASDC